jgi:hypothetical protein
MKGKQYYFVLVHQFLSILISISENTFTGFAGYALLSIFPILTVASSYINAKPYIV